MILLLIVFALTVFAALSVRASYHEMKLAEKTKESVQAYYQADSRAVERYEEIRKAFSTHVENGGDVNDFSFDGLSIKGSSASYTVESDTGRKLVVKLGLSDNGDVKVNGWSLTEEEHGDYENGSGEELWNGDIIILE